MEASERLANSVRALRDFREMHQQKQQEQEQQQQDPIDSRQGQGQDKEKARGEFLPMSDMHRLLDRAYLEKEQQAFSNDRNGNGCVRQPGGDGTWYAAVNTPLPSLEGDTSSSTSSTTTATAAATTTTTTATTTTTTTTTAAAAAAGWGELLDYWLSHCDDTARYRWWHPEDHMTGTWDAAYLAVPPLQRKRGHFVGNTHIVSEKIQTSTQGPQGGAPEHLRIKWLPPTHASFFGERLGPGATDTGTEAEAEVGTAHATFCACGEVYAYDFPFGYLRVGHLLHMVVPSSSNSSSSSDSSSNSGSGSGRGSSAMLLSRFWLGNVDAHLTHPAPVAYLLNLLANTAAFRRLKLPRSKVQGLVRHAAEEMHCLSKLLPALYAEEGGWAGEMEVGGA